MSDLADPIPDVPIFKDTLQLPYQPSTSFRLFNSLGDYVMSHLPLIDVVALGNTNRNLRAQVPSHLTRAFHALLQHYFPDHIAFRQAMRDTGAVISGSSALAFIMRDDHWTAKDLDIYVPSGDAATRLFHHLESIQGFKHTVLRGGMPAKDYEKVGSGCIRRVHKFLKRQGADEAGQDMTLTVDLIESDTNSSVKPLTSFHSTLVMNYLTADSVVVLYPSLTFSRVAFKQSRPWKTEDWEEARRPFIPSRLPRSLTLPLEIHFAWIQLFPRPART
jgi:hypothetical protein